MNLVKFVASLDSMTLFGVVAFLVICLPFLIALFCRRPRNETVRVVKGRNGDPHMSQIELAYTDPDPYK